MKKTAFLLACLLAAFSARADDDAFYGQVKIGSFGDLAYERNAEGKIIKKRSDADIKQYVADTVDKTLRTRGLSVFPDRKNRDLNKAVTVTPDKISFNVYDQSGMMLFPFSVDRKKSLTQTEIPSAERKKALQKAEAEERKFNEEVTRRRKKLYDRVKQDEKKKKR